MNRRRRMAFAALVKQAHLAQHTFAGRDDVNRLARVVRPRSRWPRTAPRLRRIAGDS